MDNGKPTIIIAKTLIGKGIPEVEGTNAAHGEVNKALLECFWSVFRVWNIVVFTKIDKSETPYVNKTSY